MNHDAQVHAQPGGCDEYGKTYRGGEFLPFYVPRPDMPQIDEKYQPQFVADAFDKIGVTFESAPVSALRAHQRINHAIAKAMTPQVKMKPVIVSWDGYIVDGNHRWWAHVHAGDEFINVIRVGLPFEQAIEWALKLPYVYRIQPDRPNRN